MKPATPPYSEKASDTLWQNNLEASAAVVFPVPAPHGCCWSTSPLLVQLLIFAARFPALLVFGELYSDSEALARL